MITSEWIWHFEGIYQNTQNLLEQFGSDMFLNINWGQVWYTAMSFDLTPVGLSCGAEECGGGKET